MTKLIDKLHKTAVSSLLVLTAGASVVLCFQVYEYLTVVRPNRAKLAEKDLKPTRITDMFSQLNMALNRRFLQLFQYVRQPISTTNCCWSSETKSWNILKVNHIAVATKDLEKSVNFYKNVLGAKTSEPIPMSEHGVTTVFVELLNTKIELLLPLGAQSPIENYLAKNPAGGMHHICLEVDNLETAVEDLKAKNIRLLGDKPKIGAHGKPVIFLHPKDCGGVLVELEQV